MRESGERPLHIPHIRTKPKLLQKVFYFCGDAVDSAIFKYCLKKLQDTSYVRYVQNNTQTQDLRECVNPSKLVFTDLTRPCGGIRKPRLQPLQLQNHETRAARYEQGDTPRTSDPPVGVESTVRNTHPTARP